ncbi:RDD family protein [Opitutus terrae]|uniref:RDD domain containing protein n=1 Tax=Opitutus terrae (strain DSM 11246 / JCM 15787 / PB90-1) TaxID=452637 RepID=B1ZUF8_OPITP|nr:RDD family protein [Opitutus terrae]ACB74001.1 RDD domain containing protein [Opitutus terrae PB90-1]
MKTPARTFFLAALASWMALTAAALAQNDPAPAAPDQSTPAAQPSATTADPQTAPAAEEPKAAPVAEQPAAPEAAPASAAEPEMRRLDQPAAEETETSAATNDEATSTDEQKVETQAPDAPEAPPAPAPKAERKWERQQFNRHAGNERVSIWQDSTLAEGEEAGAVVSIVGSSTSAGKVSDAVVSILGSSTSSGHVGGAVVSVFGSSRMTDGSVGDAVVSVLGNTYVNGRVRGDVVAVLGNVELGPQAEVHGQIVCVGGKVNRDAAAQVHGQVNNIAMGFSFGGFEWLHAWISQCLLYGRPLAFGPHLMWAWWIAIGFFVLYLAFALLFPRGIVRCAETLEQRPGFSILTAFLVTLLAPAAVVILAITVIGTPAVILGLFVAGLFGKAAMFAWVGRRITRFLGNGPLAHPFFAVLIGGVIVLLLYTVPVVGFVVAKLTSWLGVGIVIYTLILVMQRNKAARLPAVAAAAPATTILPAVAPLGATGASASMSTADAGVASAPVSVVVSAATLTRAGFWIRAAASLIDAAIVAVAVNLFPDRWEPNFLLSFATYCVVLWATKATTIGGIVCSLKVVRLDDRKLDWPTALVRVLGGFISLIPAGLGFIWVAFDDQRQSWHDKIAGTTVVYVPRGLSLL